MKTITCREAGFDCDYVVKGETEEEVMNRGAEHAMRDHGMKEPGSSRIDSSITKNLVKYKPSPEPYLLVSMRLSQVALVSSNL
jgi:predicted small metal-binding protein